MKRSLKRRGRGYGLPAQAHIDYQLDREPAADGTWEEETQAVGAGAAIHRELVTTIRRTLPMVTYEQASDAANEILALAARTANGRGRRA